MLAHEGEIGVRFWKSIKSTYGNGFRSRVSPTHRWPPHRDWWMKENSKEIDPKNWTPLDLLSPARVEGKIKRCSFFLQKCANCLLFLRCVDWQEKSEMEEKEGSGMSSFGTGDPFPHFFHKVRKCINQGGKRERGQSYPNIHFGVRFHVLHKK